MVANVTGKPVQHANFFNRERDLQKLWDRLATDDVLFLAPRRVGKTSVMYRLLEQAPSKKFTAAYLSVANADSEQGFLRELLGAVMTIEPAKHRLEKVADTGVGHFLRRIKKAGALGVSIELADTAATNWRDVGETLIGALAETEQPILLLVDELPVFVLALARQDPSGARAGDFLGWFRSLREAPRTTARVRWLLAGSIGLDTVARRLRINKTLGDLYVYNGLGPFSEESARALLDALADTFLLPLSDEVKRRICERLEWLLPYHIQLMFSEMRDHCGDHQCGATVEVVDAVYEKILKKRPYFDHWEERLHEELGQPDARWAIDLLNATARDRSGVSMSTLRAVLSKHISDIEARDEKLTYLLDVLAGDGYLMTAGDRLRFCSPLLRDYWARRIGPEGGPAKSP